ncbi:MAG: glycosyltransferase, partial [Acidimicrobiia bacterium]
LVPLPRCPGDHQTRNARALVDAGAGVLVPDGECDGGRLATVLASLLSEPARLERMGKAARALARPDAAERLAELVESAASPGKGRHGRRGAGAPSPEEPGCRGPGGKGKQ